MIERGKKRLTLIFSVVMMAFSLLLVAAMSIQHHTSLMASQRQHIEEEILLEFRPYYLRNELSAVKKLDHSVFFQLLNRRGEIMGATLNSQDFRPPAQLEFLGSAFAGETVFQEVTYEDREYLVAYFSLDENFSGRAALGLEVARRQQRNFLLNALLLVPVLTLAAWVVSRFLVGQAMVPISEGVALQEVFAENAAHELMSPLTGMRGGLEVSLRREHGPAEYREVLQENLREVNRLVELLERMRMLSASRFESGELELESMDLAALLKEVLEANRQDMGNSGIQIRLSISAGSSVMADSALLERALGNLVENAIKYTPPGGVLRVELRRKGLGGHWAEITLENDCGELGVKDPEILFAPFLRGQNKTQDSPGELLENEGGGKSHKRLRKIPGQGLGLLLARNIVRAHGGDLKAVLPRRGRFRTVLRLPVLNI
ncbi:MAG: HAMP domain-containing histidine kinase [Deltaproteobacteria bacterium]|nr:HAMP domain-containing histidine kinase [Deltaproteobacteria bacterium]